jgi:hypothetical protein
MAGVILKLKENRQFAPSSVLLHAPSSSLLPRSLDAEARKDTLRLLANLSFFVTWRKILADCSRRGRYHRKSLRRVMLHTDLE